MESDEFLVAKLRELILDENQIVTTNLLKQKYKLGGLQVQKIFEAFTKTTDGSELKFCYILTGFRKKINEAVYCVSLSNSECLENSKATYDKLHSCTIFSIQKMTIKDSGLLYCSHYESPDINTLRIKSNCIELKTVHSLNEDSLEEEQTEEKTEEKQLSKPPKIEAPEPKINRKEKKAPKAKILSVAKENKTTNGSLAKAFAKTKKISPKESVKERVESATPEKPLQRRNAKRDILSSSSEEDEPVKKTRKMRRIISRPDSDSDQDIECPKEEKEASPDLSSDEEEPIPSLCKSPTDDTEKVATTIPASTATVIEYQTVVKNYKDNDGFLVTKMEKKAVEIKVEVKKKLPRVKQPVQQEKKKQQSIVSFFRKT